MFEVMDAYSQNAVIKVIGVGGGGGNAVTHMVTSGIEGVEFLCVNTDAQALKHSKVKTSLQIGSDITKGLGAGANPDVGRAAALEDRERLIEMIDGSRHAVHHRRHGRWHRHRCGAGGGAAGQGAGNPDRRRGDPSVRDGRQQALARRRQRHRRAQQVRRFADHHPQPETADGAGRHHHAAGCLQGRQPGAAGCGAGHRGTDHASRASSTWTSPTCAR